MWGTVNRDLLFRVESFPTPGETVIATTSVETSFGGKGANVAFQAGILEKEAGKASPSVRVRLIGGIGSRQDLDNLRRLSNDVTTLVAEFDDVPTGSAVITTEEKTGENTVVVSLGANARLERIVRFAAKTHERARRRSAPGPIDERSIFVLQNEVDAVESLKLLEETNETRIFGETSVVLNLSPYSRRLARSLMTDKRIKCVVMNRGELAAADEAGIDFSVSVPLIIVTSSRGATALVSSLESLEKGLTTDRYELGELSSLCDLDGDEVVKRPHGAVVRCVAPTDVSVVDTVGAGDAFLGALAYSLCSSESVGCDPWSHVDDVYQWLRKSTSTASATVQSRGAQSRRPGTTFKINE